MSRPRRNPVCAWYVSTSRTRGELRTPLWPLDPEGFDELIESKQFTNGADKGTVKTLYCKMSKAQLSGIEMLDFTGITAPSVRDMEQLGRCLNLCENLKTCDLSSVGLTGEPCRALFSTLKFNGVLTTLELRANNLGVEGKGVIRDAVSGRVGFKLQM